MTGRRSVLVATAAVVAITLSATALAGAAGETAEQASRETLRIVGFGVDLDSVDPALAYQPNSWMLQFATSARLYSYPDLPGPAGARLVPEVARAFPRLSRDRRTATIQLRRTYRFHTGAPVTAANFVAALNRVASPVMESFAAPYLTEIVGASAVLAGRATSISGVAALDRYTLRIKLRKPLGDLVARLSMPFFCPIARNMPISTGGVDNPLGSGPFYVASRVRGRQIVLKRNRFYRGPRKATLARVVVAVGTGREACRVAVERNEADICLADLPADVARDYAARYGVNKPDGRLFSIATMSTLYFTFNHDRRAFKSPSQIPLKQAINWAIDRPALVRAGGFLVGKRTDQILPPVLASQAPIYPVEGVTSRSLAKARALLARARYKPRRLILYTGNYGTFPARAQVFQFNLKRIGIDVDIRYFSPAAWRERVETRGEPYDVVLEGWAPDYVDAASYFFPLLDGRALGPRRNKNTAYFNRPKYNRELDRINQLQGDKRRSAWGVLDIEMMRNDPPWAPFMNFAWTELVSEQLGCVVYNPVSGRLNIVAACKK